MKSFSVLATSAPVLTLLLAMLVVIPRLNAEAGPPESVFVKLDPGRPDPLINAEVTSLKSGEQILRLDVDGFTFSDICAAVETGEPIGHAHVYAGNQKIAAAYEPIVSLGKLPKGNHTLRIMLRAQDHRALVGSEGLIEQHIRVVVG
ncbi:MAG: hypothetical protein ACR2RF_12370 [Geminicoccaceae bacterium]